MIDSPDRSSPRFAADDVPRVQDAIRESVDSVDDPHAEAFSGAASGGDLLFCQAWLDAGRRLKVYLPREVDAFLAESVGPAGQGWVDAFIEVTEHPATTVIGPEPGMDELEDPHTLNNQRMLADARKDAPMIGIFVWDGAGGDGPGGTGHMVKEVLDAGGQVSIIDP